MISDDEIRKFVHWLHSENEMPILPQATHASTPKDYQLDPYIIIAKYILLKRSHSPKDPNMYIHVEQENVYLLIKKIRYIFSFDMCSLIACKIMAIEGTIPDNEYQSTLENIPDVSDDDVAKAMEILL